MNADRTIYGRYGSRSSVQEATKDISIRGLASSMSAALAIHEAYPENRKSLEGKQAVVSQFKTPDDFPSLRGKYGAALDYPGAVTKSCMHCHQVRDADRQVYRSAGQPIPDQLLFPNPLPEVVGLRFDPQWCATISDVTAGSAADVAGFQPGDEVLTLEDQPIVSLADVQWVLHHANESDVLEAVVRRGDQKLPMVLTLAKSWRHNSDILWRVSSWPLRRMGTGGMSFDTATEDQRQKVGAGAEKLALVVKHVGQYGPHGAAKKAGFLQGDIVVSFDRREDNMTPSQLLAYAAQHTKPGQTVPVVIVREGKRQTLSLPMQD